MTQRRSSPKSNYRLAAAVRHSGLFGKRLSHKFILAELCAFSDESTGRGWVYNAPLGNVAAVGHEQVRRIKRALEAEGFVEFSEARGKGAHVAFALNLSAIDHAIGATPSINEAPYSPNYGTPPAGGETPPRESISPTSRSGVIRNKNIIAGARGAHVVHIDPDGSPPRNAAGDIIETPADSATREAVGVLGHNWCRKNLLDRRFIMDAGRVIARAGGPTGQASIREAVKSLSLGHEIVVTVPEQDVRAST